MSVGQAATTLGAALIGSAPGWVGLYLANRRALGRQTRELKAHVEQQLAAHQSPATPPREPPA